jgi:hypothetical protein
MTPLHTCAHTHTHTFVFIQIFMQTCKQLFINKFQYLFIFNKNFIGSHCDTIYFKFCIFFLEEVKDKNVNFNSIFFFIYLFEKKFESNTHTTHHLKLKLKLKNFKFLK